MNREQPAFFIPAELQEALRNTWHIAVLTGAEVSAESGVPTFRSGNCFGSGEKLVFHKALISQMLAKSALSYRHLLKLSMVSWGTMQLILHYLYGFDMC